MLALHPGAASRAGVAPPKLVDWMIAFQFDGEVDYFELDPVAYASALGPDGSARYRARLEEKARVRKRPRSAKERRLRMPGKRRPGDREVDE
ncbi:MAG: hypothetical protein H7201_15310, partial [Candidatus Saccharibacteria bacterium]|nr:hypothetical protein [Microbacteriaceae bacterium]